MKLNNVRYKILSPVRYSLQESVRIPAGNFTCFSVYGSVYNSIHTPVWASGQFKNQLVERIQDGIR